MEKPKGHKQQVLKRYDTGVTAVRSRACSLLMDQRQPGPTDLSGTGLTSPQLGNKSQSDSDTKRYGASFVNFDINSSCTGRPPITIGQPENHPPRRHEHIGQGHAKRNAPLWTKTNAPDTQRLQLNIKINTEKADREKAFLGCPAEDADLAVGYYHWSNSNAVPSDLLGKDLNSLDDIREQFRVYIDYQESIYCIRLRSQQLQNVADAIRAIKVKVRHARADAASLAPLYIVDPPLEARMRAVVSPQFKINGAANRQSEIEKVVLSGPLLGKDELISWESEKLSITAANQVRFSKHFQKALDELSVLMTHMRMRVHFGLIELSLYRKDFRNSDYSFKRFSDMMAESRTKATFRKDMGDALFTAKVLQQIKEASDILCPVDHRIFSLENIKPKHSLIIVARGPTRDEFRIEADIDMINDDAEPELRRLDWQIGTTRYFQQSARKTRVSIAAYGFDYDFHLCLEVVTDEVISKPPHAFRNLMAKHLSIVTPVKDQFGFTFPSVALNIPIDIAVDETCIRSVLHYMLRGTSYVMEVAIYRRLDDRGAVTSTNCAVSLYNPDWDHLMSPEGCVMEDRVWNEDLFFKDAPTNDTGLSDFQAKVRTVQHILSNAQQRYKDHR